MKKEENHRISSETSNTKSFYFSQGINTREEKDKLMIDWFPLSVGVTLSQDNSTWTTPDLHQFLHHLFRIWTVVLIGHRIREDQLSHYLNAVNNITFKSQNQSQAPSGADTYRSWILPNQSKPFPSYPYSNQLFVKNYGTKKKKKEKVCN